MALIGLASLARTAFSGGDLSPVGAELLQRAANDPADADALMDMSTVLQLRGNRELGLAVQAQALAMRQVYRVGDGRGPRVLVILSAGDLAENNVLEFLLEDSGVRLELLYVAPGVPLPARLPEHDLVFVAVCESDRNRPLLARIRPLFSAWPRRVLNAPDRIARLSRDGACEIIGDVPGLVLPPTVRVARADLCMPGEFAIIVRPVDSQKGQGLEKVADEAGVAAYLAARPEAEFYAAPFVDYRSPDGLYRKYRIVLIEGQAFACHMAISAHWMVHYMSAGMAESAEKRAEEARFMAEFDTGFAARHRDALAAISTRLGLDYVGIDCGETADGSLLLFEVDSGMTVHAMDGADLFPYKQVQMKKVFEAFRRMLGRAAA